MNIVIQLLREEDESLILGVLEAFQKSGRISVTVEGRGNDVEETNDKHDEEILDLLDQADRERGVPYEELRKRFGL